MFLPKNVFAHIPYTSFYIQINSGKVLQKKLYAHTDFRGNIFPMTVILVSLCAVLPSGCQSFVTRKGRSHRHVIRDGRAGASEDCPNQVDVSVLMKLAQIIFRIIMIRTAKIND